ncbi:uncharacterized protein K452DRAFT_272138 [Aplosporella prunicola CBS 121167]|uniref:SnoaL-like domain-containing protein n=1 Tax=Aplosporella prunicola CBS 121167 TaxID=1176127 RepID=A0A6A6BBC2_9PEZI|nr:uncharacterized protein K452DRAFT_272138 [Aplosporella prunicola CBS 121167]KAF2141346.1 hypothetical protein K452DRAFT_272138 [Aplosporella prunicola CBS 121167]
MRRNTMAIIDGFNRMDTLSVLAFRAPNFTREILPSSLGVPVQDSAGFQRSLNMSRAVFHSFSLVVNDMLEDGPARKVCLWLTAEANTVAGPFRWEMVWSFKFDDAGRQVVHWREFVESSVNFADFIPSMSPTPLPTV